MMLLDYLIIKFYFLISLNKAKDSQVEFSCINSISSILLILGFYKEYQKFGQIINR